MSMFAELLVVGVHSDQLFILILNKTTIIVPLIIFLQMLELFFEKNLNQKINLPDSTFIRTSNNLDSHYYTLERVKDGDKDYLQHHYFMQEHHAIVSYFNAWNEEENIHQEVPVTKKPKEKKGMMGILGKKGKAQGSGSKVNKEPKQQIAVKTTVEKVMYVQLEAFAQASVPQNLPQIQQFMALLYLLALKVFSAFKCWPLMLPVIVQSRKYKFVKKGKSLTHELVSLFNFITGAQKGAIIEKWSEQMSLFLLSEESEQKKELLLGNFIKGELDSIIEKEYKLQMKKGQEFVTQTVQLIDCSTLLLKDEMIYLKLDEYDVSYYHQNQQIRQLYLQHNYENPVTLMGHRNHLIVRYLKQFMTS